MLNNKSSPIRKRNLSLDELDVSQPSNLSYGYCSAENSVKYSTDASRQQPNCVSIGKIK